MYRIIALFLLASFYIMYFAKMFIQKKQGIKTDQMGKGRTKDKTYYVEICLKIVTIIIPFAEFASIMWGKSYLGVMGKTFGTHFVMAGNLLFLLAIVCMKNNWRAGVAKADDSRKLVTNGIYQISRNPAFLGFDCLYIGMCLLYCTPVTFVTSLIGIVMFHFQIKQEEQFLTETFGEEYTEYCKKTSRYLGLGKANIKKVLFVVYLLLLCWSVFYTCTLLTYAGYLLSMIWIWPCLGIFCAVRLVMIYREVRGINKIKIPKIIYAVYLVVMIGFLIFFVSVESKVIKNMTAVPKENLDYIIVLGAKVNGTTPANPLLMRIIAAEEYAKNNPDTLLVASGGQGWDEGISEAECISKQLAIRGIDEDRIYLEDKSTSTEENLINSYQIINDADANVGIVTNGFHMYRALWLAKNAGFNNASPVPARTLFPVGIHYIVREFFGVIVYCN